MLALAAVLLKVRKLQHYIRKIAKKNNSLKVYIWNPANNIEFSDSSNATKIEQNKSSNQKYTGVGYLPDYD